MRFSGGVIPIDLRGNFRSRDKDGRPSVVRAADAYRVASRG